MDNHEVQLIGGPCGQHGPYTFYKAFKFTKNGVKRILTLSEFFFVKLWMDSDLVCIGELQLLWADKNSEQVLASLRLYFLPENTPEGRMDHGEDEVLAISEKVVLRVEDLITWITVDTEWSWGRLAKYVDNRKNFVENVQSRETAGIVSPRVTQNSLDFSDIDKERKFFDIKPPMGPAVVILSYPKYCRYRAVMKRLEGVGDEYLTNKIIYAWGGMKIKTKNTRVLFCKDSFDYPELEGHELLCNHLAPKLKGRPRGKRKKRSISPGSESNESESSVSNVFSSVKNKITTEGGRNGLRCDSTTSPRRSTRSTENSENKDFIKKLSAFMKSNKTPIGRIPSLGYKELDLYSFYVKVQKLGGYDAVTANRLWKSIYDDLSGNQASTSAATVIRRHYERFLLAYERHIKGEEYKPLPVSERRRLKSKAGNSSASEAETSEGTSRSGNTTPIPVPSFSNISMIPIITTTPPTPTDSKDYLLKLDIKPSSLRSVRVKPERLRDNKEVAFENTKSLSDIKEDIKIHIPKKDPEPETGAVAPVQKLALEKSVSPAEGKENIPLFNARDAQIKNSPSSDDDLIEVPYRPQTPEIIDLESDMYTSKTNNNNNNNVNNNNTHKTTQEVKRGKLDILKEGGLEVTPVRTFMTTHVKDMRPTVIQGNIEKINMPPPSINATLIKRPTQIASMPNMHVSPKSMKYPAYFTYNGTSPPKVVQSKSIYAPSQRMVYGDPKDLFAPPMQIQSPKFVTSPSKSSATDLLDLTVKSPQKPIVEIMRVPQIIPSPKLPTSNQLRDYSAKHMYSNSSPALPLLEGRRISSNLEITLVGPSKSQPQSAQQPQYHKYINSANVPQLNNFMPKQASQKRSTADHYAPYKLPRVEENGNSRSVQPIYQHNRYIKPHPPKPEMNLPKPNAYMRYPSIKQESGKTTSTSSMQSNKYTNMPQMYPNYLHQQAPSNKMPNPYMMDPIYMQALQSLYQSPSPVSNMMPLPTPEQLQMYTDLMARSSVMSQFPFPFPQDIHSSITSSDNKNNKKQ